MKVKNFTYGMFFDKIFLAQSKGGFLCLDIQNGLI
ncbi:MAG: hypothetical protein PWQ59_2293 [Thermoanaerobacterium sp.]|nr:hypothetical protein [Thermoanaerobacterium sp.]MDN5317500.1 hypothetical protein [Thermoanaerobacterium sp.]